ncbi:hypothetical protein SDC9_108686 [bioreactor metagenome]|uniref:Uncharacterized protein n=1 Tax=bioreactor metagenome TaxID=1076179 RepID=A0A645BF72_9ZZZZ
MVSRTSERGGDLAFVICGSSVGSKTFTLGNQKTAGIADATNRKYTAARICRFSAYSCHCSAGDGKRAVGVHAVAAAARCLAADGVQTAGTVNTQCVAAVHTVAAAAACCLWADGGINAD